MFHASFVYAENILVLPFFSLKYYIALMYKTAKSQIVSVTYGYRIMKKKKARPM